MFSIGYVMKLKPGQYAGYKEAHDNLWPTIAASMSDNHVNMSIYRFEDLLFLHAVAPNEEAWNKSREHPDLPKWAEFMTEFLETEEDGTAFFPELDEVFAFGEFRSSPSG